MFSNKRKMINKGLRKILSGDKIRLISDIKLDQRPSNLNRKYIIKLQNYMKKVDFFFFSLIIFSI